jgi:hypothetical protein
MADNGAVRRLRSNLIRRGKTLEQTPKSKERDGYIRGLEYALEQINKEFPEVI